MNSSARSGIERGSQLDFAPTELVCFLRLGYKDQAPTEPFFNPAAAGLGYGLSALRASKAYLSNSPFLDVTPFVLSHFLVLVLVLVLEFVIYVGFCTQESNG